MTAPWSPPGWYPNPDGGGGRRYWDGYQRTVTMPPAARANSGMSTKQKWWIAGAVAAPVLLVAVVGTIGQVTDGTKYDVAATQSGSQSAAPMGSTVSDGKFSFRVTGVTRSTQGSLLSSPRGEYVVVSMIVSNTGNEPQTFFSNNQKLFDASGREYEADAMAASTFNNSASGWMEALNPGFAINVNVPFDVPPGTQPVRVELHDSAFSGGAAVQLSESN